MKETSAQVYASVLTSFCEFAEVPDAYGLVDLGLDKLEALMLKWISENRNRLAPKHMNVMYCAVKRWCQIHGLVKSTKMFREIKFDRSSRKTRDRMMLTKTIVRKLYDNADLEEKIVIGFYGINGLRPSLIPQLLIEDISPRDIKLKGDTIELAEKAWIWVKREYDGNKANIDFPILTTAEESIWLQEYLNRRIRNGEKLTSRSQIVLVKNKRAVAYIVDKLYDAIGFEGRRYLLRHYAFKQLKRACEDYDLREWLMGHKGKISAIYDHEHYLTAEEIKEYKAMVDTQKLHVYGLSNSQEQIIDTRIQTIKALLKDLDTSQIDNLKRELTSCRITLDQFNERLTQLAQNAMNKQIETRFEELFLKMQQKHNGANNSA